VADFAVVVAVAMVETRLAHCVFPVLLHWPDVA
jgi:hypothetical protein